MPSLRLRSVSGPRRGQKFVFNGPRVRIGRSRDNDLILREQDQPLSSAHHAEALLDSSGSWWIVDVGSSNGTRLNNIAVDRQELKTGDRLVCGGDQFAVTIGNPSRRWVAAAAVVIVAVGTAAAFATLWPSRRSFEDVAANAARSVYVIAIEDGGKRSVLGTGFAVAADGLLATNAHVADALERRGAVSALATLAALPAPPTTTGALAAIAVQGDTFEVRRIVTASIHQGWRQGSMRDDVALLQLEAGPILAALPLADASTVASLRRGTPVAAFGFPAISTDPSRPRGRLSVDVIGDVRDEYLEVGLGIAPGTSGSPVFGESGTVVAIVVGGDFVDAPNGAKRPSGSAANWALSALVLKELLASRR